MAAGADVVAGAAFGDGLFDSRPFGRGKSLIARELIRRGGVSEAQEFAVGIGPAVLAAALDVERTRGDEGEEFVLVEGPFRFLSS